MEQIEDVTPGPDERPKAIVCRADQETARQIKRLSFGCYYTPMTLGQVRITTSFVIVDGYWSDNLLRLTICDPGPNPYGGTLGDPVIFEGLSFKAV